jgi:hypothetical protein
MFGIFEKKFGQPNSEEQKLWGECISYILLLVNFFLRLLLIVILGVTSFEHFWTIDDTKHPTFQAAYRALGLLQDDAKWDTCMREAYINPDAKKLRNLFVILLLFYSPLNLEV